ncbi:MAG: helix-turn-helix domain-containing protein [Holophagales bacterium]|nr:helix-turn-helix domain-containing protein [Holophagales bacterium]
MKETDSSVRRRPGTQPAASVPVRAQLESWTRMFDALEDLRLDGYIVSRESRPWQLASYRLGDALLQHGVDGAPHVSAGRFAPDRVGFLLAGGGSSGCFCNGHELDAGSLYRWSPGADVTLNARQPGEWFALSAPPEAEARVAAAVSAGERVEPRLSTGLVKASPDGMAALRRLLDEIAAVFERAGVEGIPEQAARQLGEELLGAVVRLSSESPGPSRPSRGPRVDRRLVVRRVEEIFAATSSQPVYVSSLSEALGIPERTLRHVFAEQYGEGPTRLLRSRRLCQVHRALLDAPVGAHVAEIAENFGFRHLGQFAADYRELFGELPSETIRRAPSLAGELTGLSQRLRHGPPAVEMLPAC